MKRIVQVNGRDGDLEWTNSETVSFRYRSEGIDTVGVASLVPVQDGVYSLLWNGRNFEARVWPGPDGTVTVDVGARRFEVSVRDPREYIPGKDASAAHGHCEIKAPMPGKVIRVLVGEGEPVAVGQGIVVVEAMKMQNEMKAAVAGIVTAVRVAPGDAVGAGQVLAVIE